MEKDAACRWSETMHKGCNDLIRQKRERKVLEAATRVTKWDGPIVHGDDIYGGDVSECTEMFLEGLVDSAYESEPEDHFELPDLLHLTKSRVIVDRLDLRDVLQCIEESVQCVEEWEPDWSGTGELEEAFMKFRDENQSVIVYEEDCSRAISLKDYLGEEQHAELVANVKESLRVKAAETSDS
jgi:hypothetical protein